MTIRNGGGCVAGIAGGAGFVISVAAGPATALALFALLADDRPRTTEQLSSAGDPRRADPRSRGRAATATGSAAHTNVGPIDPGATGLRTGRCHRHGGITMHGSLEAGSTDGSSAAPPPDWPAPGTPLAGEEPTIELPVVTEAMLAAHPPTAALTPVSAHHDVAGNEPPRSPRIRRIPALERRAPRPFAAGTAIEAGASTADTASTGDWPVSGDPAASRDPAASGDGPAELGRRWTVGAGIAAAALLLTGATVVVLSGDHGPGETAGWSPPVDAHTVTTALDGRTDAGFDLVDGARHVTVRAADLGDILYRISTPAAGAGLPRADERDGRVRLRLDGDARAVDITLHAAVRWDLRIAGGADLSTIDLSAGRVGGVDLTGGAGRIDLTLPRPDGTLGVRMSGGVNSFDVRTAERTPVRVRVGRGAGQVVLYGQRHAGVAAGRTFTPAAWGAAVDRVDVDAAAGMSALTVAPY
jgi:hypothetical protein